MDSQQQRKDEVFAELRARAHEVSTRAYAPYSGYRVGAAAMSTSGRVVTGCNVENAGYGNTLCAECGLVSELVARGAGQLEQFVCVNGSGEVIMPCGRCRQLIAEHASNSFVILTPHGEHGLDGLLPQAFGQQDLASAPSSTATVKDHNHD